MLFGGIAPIQASKKIEGEVVKASVDETVDALASAENVIIVRTLLWALHLYLD